MFALGNAIVGGPGTSIGILGTDAFAGNLIAANGDGVVILGSGSVVQGNVIGTTRIGGTPLGNGRGILIEDSGNTIGGTQPGQGNVIANSVVDGIAIFFGASNSILANSIFNNGDLGIDLGDDGFTANDPGDADTGPNN